MKSRNLQLLAGLLMIGILATYNLINDAHIQYDQIEAEITQIAA